MPGTAKPSHSSVSVSVSLSLFLSAHEDIVIENSGPEMKKNCLRDKKINTYRKILRTFEDDIEAYNTARHGQIRRYR